MLLEIKKLEKSFGERSVAAIDQWVLYRGDKVALVGANGSGKTTLLRLLSAELAPDEGTLNVRGSMAVIPQFYGSGEGDIDARTAGKLGLYGDHVHSGGEKTKAAIARAMASGADILLADEPTTNLDLGGIAALEKMLKAYRGGLVLVSHDRDLLSAVCTSVLEIESGKCTMYRCGYDDYVRQKALEQTAYESKYQHYTAERDRLKKAAQVKASKSAKVRRTPRRMGNSEARLHKMGGQRQKAKLDGAAKAAASRLAQLEKVEKPFEQRPIVFDIKYRCLHSPVLVNVTDVHVAFGERNVLDGCSFVVPNAKRTALIGPNGCGKTTLMEMIVRGAPGVQACSGLKIGYFSQGTSDLCDNESVLENAMEGCVYDECFVRTILRRLLFTRDEIGKKAGVLSGGERIRLGMAKIILGDYNLLLMDEPTNYLDIPSRTALESVMAAYPGSVLFVSHDRAFLRAAADRVVAIEHKKTVTYEGGFDAYRAAKDKS